MTSEGSAPTSLPRHVAIIMDGNGRWASLRGLPRVEGHRMGVRSVRAVVECARELRISCLTLYAFSLENWGRPEPEVARLSPGVFSVLAEIAFCRTYGLDLLYLGIETGNDELLKKVGKGATAKQIVEGSRKALQAGLRISAFIILGLGGVDGSLEHAKDSARVVNEIGPQFLATLTLIPLPDARAYEEKVMGGGFRLIDRKQSLQELRWFVEDLELTDCKFGTEHASNYLPLTGMILPGNKDEILRLIDKALMDTSPGTLRPEWMREL